MSALSLTGPCITVDTACSSSMAALNMAVNDIQCGACKYAIVAGECSIVSGKRSFRARDYKCGTFT